MAVESVQKEKEKDEGKFIEAIPIPKSLPMHFEKSKFIAGGYVRVGKISSGFSIQVATANVPFAEKDPGFLRRVFLRQKSKLVEMKGLYRLGFYYEPEGEGPLIDCGSLDDFSKAIEELQMSDLSLNLERVATVYKFSPGFLKSSLKIYERLVLEEPTFLKKDIIERVQRCFSQRFEIALSAGQIKIKLDPLYCALSIVAFEPQWAPIFRAWQAMQKKRRKASVRHSEKALFALGGAEMIGLIMFASVLWYFPDIGFAGLFTLLIGAGIGVVSTLLTMAIKSVQASLSNF